MELKLGDRSLILDSEGQVLLVQEPTKGDRYGLPGGGVEYEKGEDILRGRQRETKEETGLETEACSLLRMYEGETRRGNYLLEFIFKAIVTGGQLTPTEQHPVVRYFSVPLIRQMQEEQMLRNGRVLQAVEDDLLRKGFPIDILKIVPPDILTPDNLT